MTHRSHQFAVFQYIIRLITYFLILWSGLSALYGYSQPCYRVFPVSCQIMLHSRTHINRKPSVEYTAMTETCSCRLVKVIDPFVTEAKLLAGSWVAQQSHLYMLHWLSMISGNFDETEKSHLPPVGWVLLQPHCKALETSFPIQTPHFVTLGV